MKKILFTILLLAVIVEALAQDFNVNYSSGQSVLYQLRSDSIVYVMSVAPSADGKIVIPDTVHYNNHIYPITGINSGLLTSNHTHINSITIGRNVRILGEGAFSGGFSFDTLYYNADSCTYAPTWSNSNLGYFYQCSWNDYWQNINADGCGYNHTLTTVYIGENVKYFPETLFRGCTALRSIVIPDSVTTIPQNAFKDCRSLDSVVLGINVSTIEYGAFQGCTNLVKIVLPNTIDSIGPYAFSGCTSLSKIIMPNSCKGIAEGTFYGCTNLTTAIISDNIVTIGERAFYNCTNLDTLYIGANVRTIGNGALGGCGNIRYLYYNARNCQTHLMRGLYSNMTNVFAYSHNYNYSPTTLDSLNTLIIGDSVLNIVENAFGEIANYRTDWINIHSITIPENVQSIGRGAFIGLTNLDTVYYNAKECRQMRGSLTLPSNVSKIIVGNDVLRLPDSAFYGFTNVFDSIPWPDSIRYVGRHCYDSHSNITGALTIPSTIDTINDYAFANCTGIDTIIFKAKNCMKMNGGTVFEGCNNISHIEIGNNVQRFPDSAFTVFNHLLDTIPWRNSLRYVGAWNFPNRNDLSGNFTIPQSVDTIAEGAFYNCDNILSLNTNNVKCLGRRAFADCDRLISVTLGNPAQILGSGAFSGCFRLQNIDFGGVTTIGDSAFNGCVRLENPELPATLTSIGTRAFNGCSLLAGKLTFPATITSIGNYAYRNIGTITEIEMLGSNPPTIYEHTFASVSNSTPVSVPCGAVLNYYTTNYWENFSTIVEAPPYKLTVSTNNETMGSAAVSQQPTCNNHSAIIQATAETGFHFLQWNDGNGTNPRTIQMTQDSSFTAIFVPNNSYIVIEPNNPTMGSTTGTGTYGYNAPVTMTATAYSGYHFLKWNDGNTQNPRYMAAVRDTSFTAIFVSNVSTITVTNANPEWGNVGGSGVYYYQNLVSLTATPNYGYHFAQWNDGNTQNPRTITVAQDSTFTAYFAVNTYSIVASSNSTSMGSVSGGGSYTYLHEMSLTATPSFGYHFVQWNDQNTDNPRTITVTRDSVFTAQFAANSYVITAEPNDPTMGSAYGSGSYNFNTTATLTAVAEYGYHFTQWSDGVTDNPRTVTVQNAATYTAQFEINSYILTVQSSNPAIGSTSGSGSYNYLTPVNITAIPNAGYHFTQWSDGNTDNPRLVSITQNATYIAQFAINSYAVGVTSNNTNMGSVSGSGTYNHNSTATLTATAYYGYHFVQWQDGNTQNPRSVVVTDSTQYIAQFDYNSYLVTANSSNITLGIATGSGTYNYMSQVALTAVPTPHYHFTMWNDSIEDNPRTITVTRDTILTAHFAIDRHTIGVHTADAIMGTASSSDTVDYNTAVWISATANYGYHFSHWNDGNTQNPRRVVVLQDTAFTATFAPNQYTATCNVNDNSRGTVATTGGSYNYLTSLTFTALPDANYHFLRWSNGSTTNPITFTLTQDTTLTAILVGLTANVNDSAMGTVSHSKPSNLVEVVTASPNYGYHFVQWNDGTTDNPRTMNLVGDTSVTAIFDVNNYYVALGVNDESLGSVEGEDEYPYLSTVTITATATEHSHFLQWSDGNTTNPRMLTVTSDTSLTAYFDLDHQFQITVNANDTSRGIVEGSGTYFVGEMVTITATANEHYYFAQWSDGNTSNPRVVTVAGDAVYTAVFEPVMYTLTVTANDYSMGQVIGGGSYAYGTEVTIEARAFGGYHFIGWNDGVLEEQRTITVTEDASYLAIFEKNTGINIAEGNPFVFVSGRDIVITGATNRTINVYDIMGRKIATAEHATEREMLSMPATGVYLIVIDGSKPQKCFVR